MNGGAEVVVLSHAFWRAVLGGDPSVVGRTLTLNGTAVEVVGVMPEGFSFPDSRVQLWLPTRAGEGTTQGRGNNNFLAIGRLRGGVSLAAAQAQVDVVATGIAEADAAGWYHWLQPLHTVLFGETRTVLLVLLGIVGIVPLVACAKVASLALALARATARTYELATRRALGATRAWASSSVSWEEP